MEPSITKEVGSTHEEEHVVTVNIQDHGLILPEIVEHDHYVLGGYSGIVNRPILMPGGHGWGAFVPLPEIQNKNGLETMNCTNYGTHNALETLGKFKKFDDFPTDCSERFSGILTGTTRGGNDPHWVIERIRNDIGAIPETFLPFSDKILTWEQYYSPNPMYSEYLEIGKTLLQKFKINHEWVFGRGSSLNAKQKADALVDALQFGPVCVSVYAWKSGNDDLYFKETYDSDNHWVELIDFVEGKYWIVYDHYGLFGDITKVEKKLRWEYGFDAAKVYYLERKTTPQTKNFGFYVWNILIDRIKRGFAKVLAGL